MVSDLKRVFCPKSVAVVGASDRKDSVGYAVFRNLISSKFKGNAYPVNVKHSKVQGRTAYLGLDGIGKPIDLAVIATPAVTVPDLVRQACDLGAGGIIILSSGFLEMGKKGEETADEILKYAREKGVRIMGPNCMGFINNSLNLNATFEDFVPRKGGVAFISQSGALGSAALDWMKGSDIGVSLFASVGSMIDIGFGDLIDYLASDSSTNGIVIYMESLNNSAKFLEAAAKYSLKKPIFVIKAGRSSQGSVAAKSHTGNLAGNDKVFSTAFKRCGVVQVETIDELFGCARILNSGNFPSGKNLMVVTNAGGPGVLSVDSLVASGGELAKLSKVSMTKLNSFLPATWSRGNPVDVLGDADEKKYKCAVEVCLKDKNSDAVLVLLTTQSMTNPEKVARAISSIKSKKPVFASFIGGPSVLKAREVFDKSGIPTFEYPEDAVKSFVYFSRYSDLKRKLKEKGDFSLGRFNPDYESSHEMIHSVLDSGRTVLSVVEAKKLLENYGILTLESRMAKDVNEAVSFSNEIGYPVVLKISSPDILHKTEVGGVKVGLKDAFDVKRACREIMDNVQKKFPKANVEGIIVEKSVSKKFEVIIGSKRDEIFGPTVVFGKGGIDVNLYNDSSIGLAPLSLKSARELISRTKISKLLEGYRGMDGVNMNELSMTLARFSRLVLDFPEIKEVDINPFLVDKEGGLAVDVKIVLGE